MTIPISRTTLRIRPRYFTPFWNNSTQLIANQLPIPTQTTSHPQNITSISHYNPQLNIKNCKPKIDPLPQATQNNYIIKNIKIPLYLPNGPSRSKIKGWFHTVRYVHNRAVEKINSQAITNFQQLRQTLVTYKHRDGTFNTEIAPWECETPKDIRAETIRDLTKGYSTLLKRQRDGALNHFRLRYQTRRDPKSSIVINKRALKIRENGVEFFESGLIRPGKRTARKWFGVGRKLEKEWNYRYDARLVYDRYRFWLNFPVRVQKKLRSGSGIVALDPGVRTFQTGFSEREVIICHERRQDLIRRLRERLDGLRGRYSQGQIRRSVFGRRYYRWSKKLTGMVDNLHWSVITKLRKEYSDIFLPHFESQEIRGGRISRGVNRELDYLRHYRFKCRLREKCEESGCRLYLVDESYTSKTCGRCGHLEHNLGGSSIFKCSGCGLVVDRDVNGARNIMIKNLERKHLIKLRSI